MTVLQNTNTVPGQGADPNACAAATVSMNTNLDENQQSDPSGTSSCPAPDVPTCKCGVPTKVFTSNSVNNPGRQYYGCHRGYADPNCCKFIVWCDLRERPVKSSSPMGAKFGSKQPGNDDAIVQPTEYGNSGAIEVGEVKDMQSTIGSKSQNRKNDQVAASQRYVVCLRCGTTGHYARDCQVKRKYGGAPVTQTAPEMPRDVPENIPMAPPDVVCYYCKQSGHFKAECPKQRQDKIKWNTCYRCNQVGHWAKDCPGKNTATNTQTQNDINTEDVWNHPESARLASMNAEEHKHGEPQQIPQDSVDRKRKEPTQNGSEGTMLPPKNVCTTSDRKDMEKTANQPPRVKPCLNKAVLPLSMRGGGGYGEPDWWGE
jgi:hypothetical protein